MRKSLIIWAVFALISSIIIINIIARLNEDQALILENESIKVVVKNLDTVWAIDFLPDGKMVFTERGGKVSIYDFETEELKEIANIDVYEASESGLHGIAVDPEFDENNFIYVYYTHEEANRVSHFTFNLETYTLENEIILLDDIPNARFHDGGRIKFGPDNLLYVTTGDATTPSSAQDLNSLAGKILRMNKDGSVPKDNPYSNYVYSYGHRNPQGITWNFERGTMYESEHGPNRNDEVNVIIKGGNYGWPNVECDTVSEGYMNPISCYSNFTLAPAGIEYFDNNLYVAGLRGAQIRKLKLDERGIMVTYEEKLIDNLGRAREVVEHEGLLYIGTSNLDGRGIPRIDDDKIVGVRLE